MTAVKKISEAETILQKMQNLSEQEVQVEMHNFVKTIHDVFSHLLDEYHVKFALKIDRVGLEKFKSIAKKQGRIDAINFLMWYEREYKKLKNDPEFSKILEREHTALENKSDVIRICSTLLEEAKKMSYHAYENF
ncbi:MAG: hypothetical protein ACKOCQ_00730 [Candidatus Nitrosotenuis sp.]